MSVANYPKNIIAGIPQLFGATFQLAITDLAGTSLNHHELVLSDGRALLGVSGSGTRVASGEFVILNAHLSMPNPGEHGPHEELSPTMLVVGHFPSRCACGVRRV